MQVEYEYENGGRHGNVKGYNVSDLKNVHVSHSFQSLAPTTAKEILYTRPSLSHNQVEMPTYAVLGATGT